MKLFRAWVARVVAIPAIRFVIDVFVRFGNNNGTFFAAGLAFFMILSFAPIVLTGVAVLGFFINVHTASLKITGLFESFLPAGGARDEAAKFLSQQLHIDDQVRLVISHRGIAGIVGFLSLVWATLQIFINASTPMNGMWEVKENRNWFLLRGLALVLTVITGCLVILSIVLSGAPTAIERFHLAIFDYLPMSMRALAVLFEIIALCLNTFMYIVIYKLLPNASVSWISALFGGVIASLLFEVAKKGISSYLLKANHSIYGDLANLILFILWIYYSMIILLLGAEFSAAFTRLEKHDEVKRRNAANLRVRTRERRKRQPGPTRPTSAHEM